MLGRVEEEFKGFAEAFAGVEVFELFGEEDGVDGGGQSEDAVDCSRGTGGDGAEGRWGAGHGREVNSQR